jgi:hypothetical protein
MKSMFIFFSNTKSFLSTKECPLYLDLFRHTRIYIDIFITKRKRIECHHSILYRGADHQIKFSHRHMGEISKKLRFDYSSKDQPNNLHSKLSQSNRFDFLTPLF